MGDLLNRFEPLKKLGCFDQSNHWILYDERFERFFNFSTHNITDENILTEQEILELEEVDLANLDVASQRLKLEEVLPGLSASCSNDLTAYSNEISSIMEAQEDYKNLLCSVRAGRSEASVRLGCLEEKTNLLTIKEKELLSQCQSLAKTLETLQEENKQLYKDTRNCFTKLFSPPLLFYQLPLEQYFTICDSFMQYFKLYMQENYKTQDYLTQNDDHESAELTLKLKRLQSSFEDYMFKFFHEKATTEANFSLIDGLDLSQMHTVNLADIERETYELKLLLQHHLKVVHETLRNDLKTQVHLHCQQRIEVVFYENTKNKLERALRRQDNGKSLMKLISNALSNADLIWIAMQFDLERIRNRIDNFKELAIESQACWQRIKLMHTKNNNSSRSNSTNDFLVVIAEALMQKAKVQRNIRSETKACLYEFEKYCRLVTYALQNMVNGRAYQSTKEQLDEFDRLEVLLKPLVYDSPIETPVLYNVKLLTPIFNAKLIHSRIEKNLRQLRSQFQTNIVERMEKEPLWRASQMLWIWFLKQPKRLLIALEEVKRVASNVPLTHPKSLGGIKRRER